MRNDFIRGRGSAVTRRANKHELAWSGDRHLMRGPAKNPGKLYGMMVRPKKIKTRQEKYVACSRRFVNARLHPETKPSPSLAWKRVSRNTRDVESHQLHVRQNAASGGPDC